MELKRYWGIIWRRLWLVLTLVAIVLASYVLLASEPQQSFSSSMRFVVGVRPEPGGDYYSYDRYYTWLTAEYLVDDLSEVVKSQAFAEDVARLAGIAVPPGAIQGATSAGKLHRILSVTVIWPDEHELMTIANAIVTVLTSQAERYFAQLSTESATVTVIDAPTVAPIPRSLRDRLDLPLRLILAAIAGIGLTFLLDYLDGSVRHREDLVALGVPVLGEIPARHAWLRRLPFRRSMP